LGTSTTSGSFEPPTIEFEDEPGQTGRAAARSVRVGQELRANNLVWQRFGAAVVELGLRHGALLEWTTDASWPVQLDERALSSDRGRGRRLLHDLTPEAGGPCLVYVNLGHGSLSARVAADDPAVLVRAEEWVKRLFPRAEPTEDQRLPVTFWVNDTCGGRTVSRSIDVPGWDEIALNYPEAARAGLGRLLDDSFRPDASGQLLLWHGPPGTGKTTALRSLAWEWRTWCSLHYVTDPEAFFGSPSYMLDVLLEDEYDDEPDQWRLLVLEDTGELLAADAKERTGQGLSRLLNVVDGIVGQGLRVLVLVTTNEQAGALHPAVARPGRCAASVEFPPFTGEEAALWLGAHGLEPVSEQSTLAELFARRAGMPVVKRRRVGF
jgi:hypothetical protein